jgi:hypothetical protein
MATCAWLEEAQNAQIHRSRAKTPLLVVVWHRMLLNHWGKKILKKKKRKEKSDW